MKHALCLALILLCAGCAAPVKPWEKGTLARPEMALDPDPAEGRVDRHIHQSKEGAFGGHGVGGGGCGCN
jgi:hypothetical protein